MDKFNGVIHNSFAKKMGCSLALYKDEDNLEDAKAINEFLESIDKILNKNKVGKKK